MPGIEKLTRRLGLTFTDPGLVKLALTHRSAEGPNNERLEFLGDSVLGFVIAECLFKRFPDADEGVLSRLRAALVNQTSLANLARKLSLGDYLILGSGELRSGGYRRDSILSDALEALIGAILQDQGIEVCRSWTLLLFAEQIEALDLKHWKKDPKTRLQEMTQSRGIDLPVYTLTAITGQPHDQSFVVECRVSLALEPTQGAGSSRKKAEQQAAERMLDKLAKELNLTV